MTVPHGRGKESFRAFNRALKQEEKYILSALQKGEPYTQRDIFHFTEVLVNEYREFLRANELDVELWIDRAIDKQMKSFDEITQKYDLETGGNFEEEEENPEGENEEFIDGEEEVQNGKLLGFDIITKDNKAEIRAKGKPRKRLFTTFEEMKEYVKKVPYILAIQIVKNSISGKDNYRVWVDKSKDQKKRKKNVS